MPIKRENRDASVQLRIPPSSKLKLQNDAYKSRTSLNNLINEILESYLSSKENK